MGGSGGRDRESWFSKQGQWKKHSTHLRHGDWIHTPGGGGSAGGVTPQSPRVTAALQGGLTFSINSRLPDLNNNKKKKTAAGAAAKQEEAHKKT